MPWFMKPSRLHQWVWTLREGTEDFLGRLEVTLIFYISRESRKATLGMNLCWFSKTFQSVHGVERGTTVHFSSEQAGADCSCLRWYSHQQGTKYSLSWQKRLFKSSGTKIWRLSRSDVCRESKQKDTKETKYRKKCTSVSAFFPECSSVVHFRSSSQKFILFRDSSIYSLAQSQ